jgi:hypothetical protein
MSEPQKVKIIKCKYHEEKDVVEWLVEFISDKKRITMVWPSKDLGSTLGIGCVIPPEAMKKFCKDIEGKEINLVIESDIRDIPSFKDATDDQIDNMSKVLDKYPFFESIEIQGDTDSK